MPVADKAARSRKRRGMRTLQHQMPAPVDKGALLLRIRAPEKKDNIFPLFLQCGDCGVGETLPAAALMGAGARLLDGEDGIQQQNALPRPWKQMSVRRARQAEIAVQFLIDVAKRGRDCNAGRYREAETVRLSRPVIGILPDDDEFDRLERRRIKGGEDVAAGRVDDLSGRLLAAEKRAEFLHIGLLEFSL